jgi:hypothetical protein
MKVAPLALNEIGRTTSVSSISIEDGTEPHTSIFQNELGDKAIYGDNIR